MNRCKFSWVEGLANIAFVATRALKVPGAKRNGGGTRSKFIIRYGGLRDIRAGKFDRRRDLFEKLQLDVNGRNTS